MASLAESYPDNHCPSRSATTTRPMPTRWYQVVSFQWHDRLLLLTLINAVIDNSDDQIAQGRESAYWSSLQTPNLADQCCVWSDTELSGSWYYGTPFHCTARRLGWGKGQSNYPQRQSIGSHNNATAVEPYFRFRFRFVHTTRPRRSSASL